MIDIHSHILPGLDDGSRSAEESARMLEASVRQGITHIAATPHFYASESTPREFLLRRDEAAARLREVWQPWFPELVPGAEVYYFDGISRTEETDRLKLGSTGLLLLEMPFSGWTERMVSEIMTLQSRPGTTVLLAHIERYPALEKPALRALLRDGGVKMQCNAAFFLNWRTRRRALRMLSQGEIHFVGSDCHNMTDRAPRIGEAMQAIDRALGNGGRRLLARQEEMLALESGAPV